MSPAPEQKQTAVPGAVPDPADFVPVRTTLPCWPLPLNAVRIPIVTDRLILRPLTADDLPALHTLRTQPAVMRWTAAGRPDADPAETRARMAAFLPPRDGAAYNCAICDRATGALLGVGGAHNWRSRFGWPEVGYMLRTEVWGRGLGTEFLRGFLEGVWDKLEREVVDGVLVDARTVDARDADGNVREQLIAITADANEKSQSVLRKSGFEWFYTWQDQDSTDQDAMIDLPTFRYFPGKGKAE
ncbi:acyl-CoA N-acyltransferase [Trichocladium antarcticum]|uniref:Acyl-CoA N-acyltransferase n=1 Tax=Trichocladium antarcticum TaxID=1450529 RepID=A0AAN6UP99_9PEZI|nr:acyl-CoA N-acyltransferase [Trichocladium antarcticum]